ncbi:hypothetical protein PSA7680_01477 [Pseudoruegeria aquimaris]|uniref:Lipoprotein n=1 Tax=Pseudoruegeria aquimaris TaxID=393663 RepID=A0A1Y5S455_9RHOB|nr:hypothetical protein [Pseudoruegeria aquimaris]SLN30790.1 hypothetical protein PSA7680_01477 [Pseudoruegeria aquimaris]
MKALLTAAAVSVLALAGCNTSGSNGNVFLSQNSLQVLPNPARPVDFEVLKQAPNGASDYWCAAGDYVMRRLGVSPTARVYLRKPSGPAEFRSGRQSVGFTVDPSPELRQRADLLPGRLAMSMTRVGENWGAEHARFTCQTRNSMLQF